MIYMGDEYGEFGGADPDNRHMWRDNESQNDRERGLLENISQLGILRSDLESLRRGGYVSLHNASDIVVFQRSIGDLSSLVALNRGTTNASIDIGSMYSDHRTVFGVGGVENGTSLLNVTSHSVTILTNETAPQESVPDPIEGCTDVNATNYNPSAEVDDNSCEYPVPDPIEGCMDVNATNYNPSAEVNDDSCEYTVPDPIGGCMDVNATNHNSSAEVDDGSCEYLVDEPEPVPDDNETNSTEDPDPIVCSTDLCWDGSSRNLTDCSCPSEEVNESDNENSTELEGPLDPGSEIEEDNNSDSDIEDESSSIQKRRPVLIVALVLVIIVSVTFMFFRRS